MVRLHVSAIIACAMEEELAPFLKHSKDIRVALPPRSGNDTQAFYLASLGGVQIALVRSGIGLTNAAAAAERALENFEAPLYVLAGTTGGLREDVAVREVVAATASRYLDADATAFGYKPGQIPQMPVQYESHLSVPEGTANWVGEVVSGNSFVTAHNVGDARSRFPRALAVDMETVAAAQVCYLHDIPWLSLRAVSDLCGPAAGQEFHVQVETAAELSYRAVRKFLLSVRDDKWSPEQGSSHGR